MFDDLGRIVIPREIRQCVFGNEDTGGKSMEISCGKDGIIFLKPVVTEEKINEQF